MGQNNTSLDYKFGQVILSTIYDNEKNVEQKLRELTDAGHAESALTLALWMEKNTPERAEMSKRAFSLNPHDGECSFVRLNTLSQEELRDFPVGSKQDSIATDAALKYSGAGQAVLGIICQNRSQWVEASYWHFWAYLNGIEDEEDLFSCTFNWYRESDNTASDEMPYESNHGIFGPQQYKDTILMMKCILADGTPSTPMLRSLQDRMEAGSGIAGHVYAKYLMEKGCTQEAKAIYKRMADAGDVYAMRMYATILLALGMRKNGKHFDSAVPYIDADAAMPYITKAAERGEASSMYLLGQLYFNDDAPELGAMWLRKAVNRQVRAAAHTLGSCIRNYVAKG